MLIEKATLLEISHRRKGTFRAVATHAFDTEEATWYPVALTEKEYVAGMGEDWVAGERISCRASLVNYIKPI